MKEQQSQPDFNRIDFILHPNTLQIQVKSDTKQHRLSSLQDNMNSGLPQTVALPDF